MPAFWYQDNDESKNIIEFRMKVHVAAPQPFMVSDKRQERVRQRMEQTSENLWARDFYVDDGLKSLATTAAAIDLLKRTQEMLTCSNLMLHKITSKS